MADDSVGVHCSSAGDDDEAAKIPQPQATEVFFSQSPTHQVSNKFVNSSNADCDSGNSVCAPSPARERADHDEQRDEVTQPKNPPAENKSSLTTTSRAAHFLHLLKDGLADIRHGISHFASAAKGGFMNLTHFTFSSTSAASTLSATNGTTGVLGESTTASGGEVLGSSSAWWNFASTGSVKPELAADFPRLLRYKEKKKSVINKLSRAANASLLLLIMSAILLGVAASSASSYNIRFDGNSVRYGVFRRCIDLISGAHCVPFPREALAVVNSFDPEKSCYRSADFITTRVNVLWSFCVLQIIFDILGCGSVFASSLLPTKVKFHVLTIVLASLALICGVVLVALEAHFISVDAFCGDFCATMYSTSERAAAHSCTVSVLFGFGIWYSVLAMQGTAIGAAIYMLRFMQQLCRAVERELEDERRVERELQEHPESPTLAVELLRKKRSSLRWRQHDDGENESRVGSGSPLRSKLSLAREEEGEEEEEEKVNVVAEQQKMRDVDCGATSSSREPFAHPRRENDEVSRDIGPEHIVQPPQKEKEIIAFPPLSTEPRSRDHEASLLPSPAELVLDVSRCSSGSTPTPPPLTVGQGSDMPNTSAAAIPDPSSSAPPDSAAASAGSKKKPKKTLISSYLNTSWYTKSGYEPDGGKGPALPPSSVGHRRAVSSGGVDDTSAFPSIAPHAENSRISSDAVAASPPPSRVAASSHARTLSDFLLSSFSGRSSEAATTAAATTPRNQQPSPGGGAPLNRSRASSVSSDQNTRADDGSSSAQHALLPLHMSAVEMGVHIVGASDWVYDEENDMFYSFDIDTFWDNRTEMYFDRSLGRWAKFLDPRRVARHLRGSTTTPPGGAD